MTIEIIQASRPGLGVGPVAIIAEDTHISRWVRESGRLDHDQSALPRIGELIKPGTVVVDGGALIGDHSLYYASLGAHVIAFEPNSEAFECLLRNRNEAQWSSEVITAYQIGLSDRSGECVLERDENAGATHIGKHVFASHAGCCTVAPLDYVVYFGGHGEPVDLIKLDIEGFEVRALRGAAKTIAASHPILVLEVNRGALERAGTSAEELHALVTSYGYSGVDLFSGETWKAGDERPQFDVVCRWGGR